jgi:hypothetical protein
MITTRYALEIIIKHPQLFVLKLNLDKRRTSGKCRMPLLYDLSHSPLGVSLVIDMVPDLKVQGASIHRMYF